MHLATSSIFVAPGNKRHRGGRRGLLDVEVSHCPITMQMVVTVLASGSGSIDCDHGRTQSEVF